ncbi:MAG: TonB-dependent receptor [Woeseiaceae bacterium]
MQKSSFSKKPLAMGVALALGATALTPAVAQDDEVIEEIVTVGIRSSLISSMNTKRAAKGVVDAITAEDIGKFPDTNLAESMQRIPGVSIDRANNEGSKVTVRGFGPEFNLVLLNGRQMPTTQLSGDSTRSWDFANIASEGVSAVNVYKTFTASKPSGGIGSTIDVMTAKPFDKPGLVASFGVKAMMDTTNEKGDDVTPEFSGIFSNTFADDTLGVGVFFSRQERDSRISGAEVALWRENVDNIPASTVITDNRSSTDINTFYPRNYGWGSEDISRTRTNGSLTFQYAPSDALTATLDYKYAEFDNTGERIGVGIWFGDAPNTLEAEIDQNGTYVYVVDQLEDYASNKRLNTSNNEINSIGFNLDWQVNDDLNLTFDFHDSDSDSRGTGRGNDVFLILAAACINTKSADFRTGNDIPDMDVTWINCVDAEPDGTPTGGSYDSLFGQAGLNINESEVTQFQIDGEWANADDGGLTSIQFGLAMTENDYRTRAFNSGQIAAGWYGGNQDVFDNSIFTRVSTDNIATEFSGGGSSNSPDFYYDWDFERGVAAFEQVYNGGSRLEATTASPVIFDHKINEETTSVYLQANAESDFNGFPVTMVAGIRYEDTDIKASSLQIETEEIVWFSPTEWAVNRASGATPSNEQGDYSLWLPNLDISVDVRDDMIARFSYSKSVTRPSLTSMRGTTSLTDRPKPSERFGDAGNPNLVPFTSDNFDLSFEWYYDEGSYASIGYYRKQVENFIVTEQIDTQFANLRDPSLGPRAQQAIADVIAAGGDANDPQQVHDQININAGNPLNTPIVQAADDPIATWKITSPRNLETATLYGWEFAVQHLFGDSGFGIGANYTLVKGDIDVDVARTGFQFVLPGLSDSANLVGFYENDKWQARVAYNWRDEFLNGTPNNSPSFTEEFAQWDANASYLVTDNLTVFVEGLNLTNESQRTFNRYQNQLLAANQFEARYNIGARYTFE